MEKFLFTKVTISLNYELYFTGHALWQDFTAFFCDTGSETNYHLISMII